jgi:hypothetical protein
MDIIKVTIDEEGNTCNNINFSIIYHKKDKNDGKVSPDVYFAHIIRTLVNDFSDDLVNISSKKNR